MVEIAHVVVATTEAEALAGLGADYGPGLAVRRPREANGGTPCLSAIWRVGNFLPGQCDRASNHGLNALVSTDIARIHADRRTEKD